ncbi:MAG: hypothetical protein Aurels2KO_53410 [Aureliella sp.]
MEADKSIAIFARQYWPTTCDASLRLRSWVDRLVMDRWRVQIFTPRWHRDWPERMVVDQATVVRIDDPPTNALRHRRFTKNVIAILERLQGAADLLYCDSIDPMATAIAAQGGGEQPASVVRFYEPAGSEQRITKQAAEVLQRTDAVVAADARSHRRLLSLGIMERKILRDVDTTIEVIPRRDEQRMRARQILRSVNYDLNVKHSNRVVVCLASFDSSEDILQLAKAHQFIDGHPEVRIWLIGDGPARGAIYEKLRYEGVHRSVVMPGMFSSLTEIVQAADLCLIPPSLEGVQWLLPTCLRSGVSVLCPKGILIPTPNAAASMVAECSYDPSLPGDLEAGLVRWLGDQAGFQQASKAFSQTLPTQVDLQRMQELAGC